MTATTQSVLVTGASGFIARHVLLQLLERGYRVRGSLRTPAKAEAIRKDLRAHLGDPALADTALDFVTLDLTADAGWPEALAGMDALIHTASPFPLSQPRDPQVLIRPAVEGTRRALEAALAAGVDRVVLTSSVAAVLTSAPLDRAAPRTEADWTDPDHPATTPYGASKTLAERAAWAIAAAHPALKLTTVNPGMVMGAPLGTEFGSSVGLVRRMMRGGDPALPRMVFDVVDVTDVARMHVAALETPATIGERLICSAGPMWMPEMGAALKKAYPDRRIPTRVAPYWLLWLIARFDPALRSVLPIYGQHMVSDAGHARRLLDFRFVPPERALLNTAAHLVATGAV